MLQEPTPPPRRSIWTIIGITIGTVLTTLVDSGALSAILRSIAGP